MPKQSEPENFFQTFAELEDYLNRRGMFHMDLGLTRLQAVLKALFAKKQMPFATAQVVGTNGKGSTSTFLASLCTAHGLKNGLYTSPHFVSMRERVLINGRPLPEAEWLACANLVLKAQNQAQSQVNTPNQNQALTYFEFITVLAILAFTRAEVKVAVLEAGLGGEFDATSAVWADLLLFTPIGLDHQNTLGPTLADIAQTKARAMQTGQMVLTAPQEPKVISVLKSVATAKNLKIFKAASSPPNADAPFYPLGLSGEHQIDNARLALAGFARLAEAQNWPLRQPAVRRGLKHAFIPGRLQLIDGHLGQPPLLLDGAHNAPAFATLDRYLSKTNVKPRCIIFSCLSDKDLSACLPMLNRWTQGPIIIPPIAHNPRAANPAELAAAIGPQAIVAPDLKQALQMAATVPAVPPVAAIIPATPVAPVFPGPPSVSSNPNSLAAPQISPDLSPDLAPVLICGSLFLLGEFFELHPACLGPLRG